MKGLIGMLGTFVEYALGLKSCSANILNLDSYIWLKGFGIED